MKNTIDVENDSTIAFTGGRILTMDSEQIHAETVVISGGRIAAVGEEYTEIFSQCRNSRPERPGSTSCFH
jgi:predicted amidohydrolase YtcJ